MAHVCKRSTNQPQSFKSSVYSYVIEICSKK